jgi:hypothetical protein
MAEPSDTSPSALARRRGGGSFLGSRAGALEMQELAKIDREWAASTAGRCRGGRQWFRCPIGKSLRIRTKL